MRIKNQLITIASQYKKSILFFGLLFGFMFLPAFASAATYYIDFTGGSDSNNGTAKVTSWQHAPGMAGFTGSYSHTAGDRFIFKGGTTWPASALPLTIANDGASSNRDYYGIDDTWYTGGSYSKPIFDGEYTDNTLIMITNVDHVNIDGLELKRVTHATLNWGYGLIVGGDTTNVTISNCYLHGWRTGAATDDAHGGVIIAYGPATSTVIENCEIENSENSAAWSGVAVRMVGVIRNSEIHDVSSAVLFTTDFDGSQLYNVSYPQPGFDVSYHANGVYLDPQAMGTTTGYIRNSTFHDVDGGANMAYPNPYDATVYVYNNLFYGVISDQMAIEIDPYDYGQNQTSGAVYIYNNTGSLESGQPFVHVVDRGGAPKLATLVVRNNHLIGTGVTVHDGVVGTVDSVTSNTNLMQTLAAAATDGYTLGGLWEPTASGDGVDAGVDLSGVFAADRNGEVRTAPWDIGTYEYTLNSDQDVDLLLDFEGGVEGNNLSTAILNASSRHGATWGSWSISDSSNKLNVSSSGEKQALVDFTANSTTYDDAFNQRGMGFSLNGGNPGFATFTPSTSKSAMSIGMWYKTVDPDSWDSGPLFLNLWSDSLGNLVRLYDRNNASNVREIGLISATSTEISVSDNTWYWVTLKYVNNSSSCQFALFDTSATQVGTTQTFTCPNYNVDLIKIGSTDTITSQAQTAYFDDLVLDWTAQAFPLGIASADSEDPVVTSFTIPTTSGSLTVPITTFTATDNVGVTEYLINESSAAPSGSDPDWSVTAPTEYVASSSGSKTLYAWAKDEVGNISASVSDAVTIAAQTYHIRTGASGNGDGSNWTNAFTTIPTSFGRGDTYYIADGTYSGNHTLDDALVGTAYIYVKKATESAHGSGTGWSSTYGDGVAVFTGSLLINTGYWDFDGVTGGGPASWTTGHGIEFTSTAGTNIAYFNLATGVSNIRVHRIYFNQTGNTEIYTVGATAIYNAGTLDNSLFEYLYFNNIGGLPYLLREGTGNIFQYNYSGNICGVSVADIDEHCEGIVIYGMDDMQYRWNFITESPSSGGFVKNDFSTSTSVRIYGNFFQDGGSIQCNTGTCTDWRVFNNSINDAYGPVAGDGIKIGAMFYNNVTYNSAGVSPWTAHDYNWWSDTTMQCSMDVNTHENITDNYPDNCDALAETRDPYVDSSGDAPEDFMLSTVLTGWPGIDVCDLDDCTGEDRFDIDAFGNTRGADGVWDMGAYEFDETTTFSVGGTISGLTGTVVLRNNGGDDLSRSANGVFTFVTELSNSASYAVTVFTQPSGQTCVVSNGSGTVSSANVTNVGVVCTTDDVTPPVRSAGSPSGELASGTTGTTMTLTTNETATCKYGTTTSTAYGSIASTFTTTAGTSHSQNLTGLTDSTSYNYYIRCIDASTNANTDDYTISFSVAAASGGGGGGGGGGSRPTPTPVPAPSNSTSLAFTNIKLVTEGETYYVIKDGKRYGVTNPGILFSYGLEFIDGVLATVADNAIPYTENLKPGDGSLVKKPNDSTVYLIFDNSKHGFTSESTFNALGYSFINVLEVTTNELDALPIGIVIANPDMAHPNGTFINQDGTIFRISQNQKFGIPSMEVYNSYNPDNSFAHVVLANAQDRLLSIGSVLNKREVR